MRRVFLNLAIVHNLLPLSLRTIFSKDKERVKCITEAKYRRFECDKKFRKN